MEPLRALGEEKLSKQKLTDKCELGEAEINNRPESDLNAESTGVPRVENANLMSGVITKNLKELSAN